MAAEYFSADLLSGRWSPWRESFPTVFGQKMAMRSGSELSKKLVQ